MYRRGYHKLTHDLAIDLSINQSIDASIHWFMDLFGQMSLFYPLGVYGFGMLLVLYLTLLKACRVPKNPLPKPQGSWQIWWWPNDWHHGQFCDSGRGCEQSRVWGHVVPQWSPETLETEVALLETWFDEQEGFLALNWSVFDRFLTISP